jgi:hypothetical protein
MRAERDTLVLQVGGWSRGLPVKHILVSNHLRKLRKGRMNGKRHQLNNKDYEFGTWNVITLFKSGVTKSLLQQLKDYRIKIAAIQETKWKEN